MARRSSSALLAAVLAITLLYAGLPVLTSTFVGTPGAFGKTSAPLRGVASSPSLVSMSAAPGGGGAGGPPTRINLAFLGFFAGMAALGLLGAFFYGSYVGLGSSL
mmetsp:Transcript_37657/g.86947  ORF Transcript_37657/g.86947 Transcript_37657/m.86947 type:complete len:105 (+) Transcript_37657:81-395(+)|eukprot:2536564-Amphidinium_carterae.1